MPKITNNIPLFQQSLRIESDGTPAGTELWIDQHKIENIHSIKIEFFNDALPEVTIKLDGNLKIEIKELLNAKIIEEKEIKKKDK